MILLIDNYDSFTHNLARYLRRLSVDVIVARNDHSELLQIAKDMRAIVISPGPCGPLEAGSCVQIIEQLSGQIPILGICLGHQCICHAFGGKIVRASRPIHGQAFPMSLSDTSRIFGGIRSGTLFARYHSLVAQRNSLPDCLRVTATCTTTDYAGHSVEEVMAVEHVDQLTFGVQFHPESILSEAGYDLLANFLTLCGWDSPDNLPASDLAISNSLSQKELESIATAEHAVALPQY